MTPPTSSCVFGWPIQSDVGKLYTPALSGGSWQAANPLTNLQDARLDVVARSSDALAASTQFDVDLGVARAIRVIALPYHTISSAGTIRIRGYAGAGHTSLVYDSGTNNVWESGLTVENTAGMNIGYTIVPTADQTARYWLIEITDTGNAAGYVDVGRLILAAGWQPSVNLSIGAKLPLVTKTDMEDTDGGATTFTTRPVRRQTAFEIKYLQEAEALDSAYTMQRIAGASGQIMWVQSPTTTTQMHNLAYLATLEELNGIEYPFSLYQSVAFRLREVL